jgi:hypothetical protein
MHRLHHYARAISTSLGALTHHAAMHVPRTAAHIFLALQAFFTLFMLLVQVDVVLALILLPKLADYGGFLLIAPFALWLLAEVVLVPLTVVALVSLLVHSSRPVVATGPR